jgi:hypothetical protein
MIPNRKRTYALAAYTIEHKAKGWFYKKTYSDDVWHGPYSSEFSVCLMVARQLRRELVKRDGLPTQPRLPPIATAAEHA